jgi:hypothetical protein
MLMTDLMFREVIKENFHALVIFCLHPHDVTDFFPCFQLQTFFFK